MSSIAKGHLGPQRERERQTDSQKESTDRDKFEGT